MLSFPAFATNNDWGASNIWNSGSNAMSLGGTGIMTPKLDQSQLSTLKMLIIDKLNTSEPPPPLWGGPPEVNRNGAWEAAGQVNQVPIYSNNMG